jgi:hypothetical protein
MSAAFCSRFREAVITNHVIMSLTMTQAQGTQGRRDVLSQCVHRQSTMKKG